MEVEEFCILCMELIGTVAFSISGVMVGIRKKMDVFGVCMLGIVTAVGGGMVRDVIIGRTPVAFTKPIYVETALISALIPFCFFYFNRKITETRWKDIYAKVIFLMDSVGLGIFTVVGVSAGIQFEYEENMFFLCFLGAMTGVGGGLLRDMMAGEPPYIFTKHIYACASIAGAICYVIVDRNFGQIAALVIATVLVVFIRSGAAHYRWNLPTVKWL